MVLVSNVVSKGLYSMLDKDRDCYSTLSSLDGVNSETVDLNYSMQIIKAKTKVI